MPDEEAVFASTEKEALARYEEYRSNDPYPKILPALLNSAQIQAYILKTGMVYPYSPNDDPKKERLTSASLIMTIGPEVLYWDVNDNQEYEKDLPEEEAITLRPNSITFLRPAERFNIPDYIAVRFNLRIVHVHRGLLLGTGPLLDPGYMGYPMIPVHNLTDNEYIVRVGDEFLNVEFTKISRDVYYDLALNENGPSLPFKYKDNRKITVNFDFTKFIDKNVPQRRVKSSLSSVIDRANEAIEHQKEQVSKAEKSRKNYSIMSISGALLALGAFIYAGYQLTLSATNIIDSAREKLETIQIQQVKIDKMEESLKELKSKIQIISENK